MVKKLLLFAVIFLVLAGFAFSQEDNTFPRHGLSIDAGGTMSTLFMSALMQSYGGTDYLLGSAVQYEFQINEHLSTALRFEYKILNTTIDEMTTMSLGGHFRWYPNKGIFFLDGMIGYATLTGSRRDEVMPISHYLKFGTRLGWRIDFGSPRGIFIEPSLGYYGVIGQTNYAMDYDESDFWSTFLGSMDELFIRGYFVGGPCVSFAIGFRF